MSVIRWWCGYNRSPSYVEFSAKINTVLSGINELFRSNLLSLNFNKTYFLQFRTKNCQKFVLNITLLNKHFTDTAAIKFLGLTIDGVWWKCQINHIVSRLGTACSAVRTITPLMVEETKNALYFVCTINKNLWYNF
jgi:hypothetical protein